MKDENISKDDYEFAKTLYNSFKLQNLGELHDLYMATDVMLLADVFESFRETALSKYELDPAHYLTAPSLSWAACLKMTGVEIELMTDIDMSMFVDRGLIGGVSAILEPYAKANNKECSDFDPKKQISWIKYVDANNLYGCAMIQYLPTGGFVWMDVTKISDWGKFIAEQEDEQEDGYFLEVDLEYPVELHDTHDTFPMAPEKIKIEKKFLSDYQKQLGEKCGVKYGTEKLCLTLNSKEKYVLHYRNLKQYMKHGLILKKVNQVLSFK